jgi:UDP-3-O-[3-hydroxymyristoyl] N-acetylglucosamine deacetylase
MDDSTTACQRTLKAPISCVGIGLHSGQRVSVTLHPAPAGHGVVFRRGDLRANVAARFDHVVDVRLATTLGIGGARVGTVEHLMAALSGLGIDNALVELDGPELPILDGSAAPWMFLLDCAGSAEQAEPRRVIEVRRRMRLQDGDS